MKKKSNKFLAILLALMMVAVFVPTFSFADTPDGVSDEPAATEVQPGETLDTPADVAEDTEEPVVDEATGDAPEAKAAKAAAKDAKVTMTVNYKGVIAKTKKGKIMYNQPVTVKDINKDGNLTYDEALVAAHKAYSKASGFAIGDDGWVTKLWGDESGNFFFVKNGEPTYTVNTEPVAKGDKLYVSVNADNVTWADWYTYFDKESITTRAKREITLNLTGFQAMAGNPPAPVEDVKIGTWKKGKFVELKGVVTDSSGNATFKINKKGTYYVTAYGTVKDVSWGGEDIDAPIMAPVCKVVVKKAKAAKAVNVKMTVNNKGVIAKTKKGKIMWNQTVKVVDTNKDGKLTYNEALVAAHKKYNKKKGYKTTNGEYGIQVTKLWGVSVTNTLFLTNGVALDTNVGSATVKKNDNLYASINADNDYYSDWYTYFDKTTVTQKANREITLNLTGFQAMKWGAEPGPVKDVQLGTWKKGKFVPMEGVKTDDDGNVTFTFKKAGTYYVTAQGTIPDTAMDWNTYNTVDVDAPTMAPVCKVVVKKAVAAKDAKVELSVSNKGVFAKAKDGSAMFDKKLTVKDANKDGKVTVDELLVAAHKSFNTADGYAAPGGYVSKLWGVENNNGFLFFVNDHPIQTGVAKDEVVTGDKVTAAIMSDTEYWMDFYTYFDTHTKTVKAGETFTLTLSGYMGAYGPGTGAEPEETEVGLWVNGEYVPLNAYADEDGVVTLEFAEPGTYLVTTASDDYQDVIAAGCLVTVTE